MPPSMKTFNTSNTYVKIDVAAIEWPANVTSLVHNGYELVCRTTDPDESKEGADALKCINDLRNICQVGLMEAGETRIQCNEQHVIGDIDKLVLPVGMQTVNLCNTGITGTAES